MAKVLERLGAHHHLIECEGCGRVYESWTGGDHARFKSCVKCKTTKTGSREQLREAGRKSAERRARSVSLRTPRPLTPRILADRAMVDAIRECLGLDPLYEGVPLSVKGWRRAKKEAEQAAASEAHARGEAGLGDEETKRESA